MNLYSVFCALALLCTFVTANEKIEPPPIPEGFEFEGEGEPSQLETWRLENIVKSKRDKNLLLDQKVMRPFRQQIWRMLHMDEDTHDAALRFGISRLPFGIDFEQSFFDAVLEYYQSAQLAEIIEQAGIPRINAVVKPRSIERRRSLEFTLFHLLVLKHRDINLESPEKGIWALDSESRDLSKSKSFVNACYDFIIKHATSDRVREYVAYCMAMTPCASRQLRVLKELWSLEPGGITPDHAEYLEGCAQASELLSRINTRDPQEIIIALLIDSGPARRVIGVRNLSYNEIRPNEKDKEILQRVVAGIDKLDKRTPAQEERLNRYKEILVGKIIRFVHADQQAPVDIKNSYFGF